MEAVAKLRNCPLSARKMRMVAEIIRGKNVDIALNTLRYTKREAASWMEKVLVSAIANWEQKHNMTANADDHDLFIKTLLVDEAGMLKRVRPAPHGRAHRIRKRSNHVTLVVENKIPLQSETDGAGDEEE